MIKLKELLTQDSKKHVISEWLTYNQLIDATKSAWPSRFDNMQNVRTVPPEFVLLKDGNVKLDFDFRSQPSTEGKSHQGSIKFAPNNSSGNAALKKLKGWWSGMVNKFNKWRGKKVPRHVFSSNDLKNMKCKVSCTCKDFKYRMEKANQMQGASDINFSNGSTPDITNPDYNPGLCKHLLGTMQYLTGDIEVSNQEED